MLLKGIKKLVVSGKREFIRKLLCFWFFWCSAAVFAKTDLSSSGSHAEYAAVTVCIVHTTHILVD